MPAGRHIAAGARVGLGDFAGGEELLLLHQQGPQPVAALVVSPDARLDIAQGVHDIVRPIVAELPLWTLGRIAGDGQFRVDEQIEPVAALLDIGAPLGPDGAIIGAAVHDRLHPVGQPRQRGAGRGRAQMIGLVGEEVLAGSFRRNVALALILALVGGQALHEAGGRQDAVEIHIGQRTDHAREAIGANAQPVDLFKTAGPIGEEALTGPRPLGHGGGAFLLPWAPVALAGHVGQGVEPVFGPQLHLIDRLVGLRAPCGREAAVGGQIAVRGAIEVGGVALQRMRGELLHIDLYGRGETLGAQGVELGGLPVLGQTRRQAMHGSRLVGGDERRGVLDGRRGSRQMGDPHFLGHMSLRSSGLCRWAPEGQAAAAGAILAPRATDASASSTVCTSPKIA